MTQEPAAIARVLRDRAQRELWIVASGQSMLPRLADGVRLLVRPSGRRPRTGEVWVFVSASGEVVAHRFLRRTRLRRFVFFGDNERRADQPVPALWLVGHVVEVDEAGIRRGIGGPALGPVVAMVARGLRRRLDSLIRRGRKDKDELRPNL